MARLAFFIDGGYAAKLAQHHFKVWIAYEKIGNKVRDMIARATYEPLDILRTYYYDSLPYQSNPPSEDEKRMFSQKRSFFDALRRLPRFEVREGHTVRRGFDRDNKPIYQQKRVDLMIGLDIAGLAMKRQVTHMALLSGDSDLLPAIKVAQNEGVSVWLVHGPKPTYASELWQQTDDRLPLEEFIEDIRRS